MPVRFNLNETRPNTQRLTHNHSSRPTMFSKSKKLDIISEDHNKAAMTLTSRVEGGLSDGEPVTCEEWLTRRPMSDGLKGLKPE